MADQAADDDGTGFKLFGGDTIVGLMAGTSELRPQITVGRPSAWK